VSRAEAERERREADAARDEARRLSHHASEAAQRAERDPLTGLGNRAFLARRAAELAADKRSRPLALAMLDLDGFKAVNDERGHAAGDALLIHLAQVLRHALRSDDVLCRIGGDEFVLLLPRTGAERAREVCERVCADVRPSPAPRRGRSRPASA
jgi:diguanylate cyclase